MNEFKTPELSLEDRVIQHKVERLIAEHDYLLVRIEELQRDDHRLLMTVDWGRGWKETEIPLREYQRIVQELNYCQAALVKINAEINSPDEGTLWTSDEISAQIVEEWHYQAVQECQRIADEIDSRQRLHLQQYGNLERSTLIDVMEIELQEAKDWRDHCADSLSANPKSDWLPF